MAESRWPILLMLAVPGSDSHGGRIGPEALGPSPDLDDFGSIIPLDCRTSTPVASRKRGLRKGVGHGQGQGGSPRITRPLPPFTSILKPFSLPPLDIPPFFFPPPLIPPISIPKTLELPAPESEFASSAMLL